MDKRHLFDVEHDLSMGSLISNQRSDNSKSSVINTDTDSTTYPTIEGFKDGLPLNVWDVEDILYGYMTPWDELSMLFYRYENTGFGEMSSERFRWALHEPDFRTTITHSADYAALQRLEVRCAEGRSLMYQEFVDIISNKRRRSFTVAVHCRDKKVSLMTDAQDVEDKSMSQLPGVKAKVLYRLADEFLPGPEQREARTYYSLQYSCYPPPLFIPTLTTLHICSFLFYVLTSDLSLDTNAPVPIDSPFIFRSDLKHQLWRFITYAGLHAGWWHLSFNVLVQLLIGLPLEMLHGSVRVVAIYISGILAGSLYTSLFDTDVYLVGASGGVYALLAAHVANVLLNYSHVDCGFVWLLTAIGVASIDVAFAIWDRYVRTSIHDHPVSYLAHLTGALAGLLMGFLVLKQFTPIEQIDSSILPIYQQKETISRTDRNKIRDRDCIDRLKDVDWLWWTSLIGYFLFVGGACAWNVLEVFQNGDFEFGM